MTAPIEGRRLGAYRMGRRLGAGGIGAVYEATHTRTGRSYAVKVLLPESTVDPNGLRRFRREAEALASLGHVGIVAVHDFDVTDDGVAYLVMDRLEGEDLAERLERGPLPLDVALRIFDEIAEALAAAHDAGILHRDLKPSNVFLARRPGAPERAVLLDFGLAKMVDASESQRLTATGATMMGTPMYMSPEQAQGAPVDPRTDVYSLAAILFEMLTGSPPFTGPTITAILAKVLTHPPPSLRSIDPSAPEALDPVIRAALAKTPEERPATVRAFKAQVFRASVALAATTPVTEGGQPLPATAITPRQLDVPRPAATPGDAGTGEARPGQANASADGGASRAPRLALWGGLVGGLAAGLSVFGWLATAPKAPDPSVAPIVPAEIASLPVNADAGPAPDTGPTAETGPTRDAAAPTTSTATSDTTTTPRPRRRPRPRTGAPAPRPTAPTSPAHPPSASSQTQPTDETEATVQRALAQASASADEAIARTERKIATYEALFPTIARLRRQLGSTQTRPPLCDDRSALASLGRVSELRGGVSAIEHAVERFCDLFDAWVTPRPEVQARIDRLGERFARARRDLRRRSEEDLPPAERDALLAELDALERAIAVSSRFPCAAPELRNLMRHAQEIGPVGAQPALEAGRAVDAICANMHYAQLAPAHRNLGEAIDRLEQTVHAVLSNQRRALAGFRRARRNYGP